MRWEGHRELGKNEKCYEILIGEHGVKALLRRRVDRIIILKCVLGK
jgi:hypothetical protein